MLWSAIILLKGINNMERRYRETESSAVREELAKYIVQSSLCLLWWYSLTSAKLAMYVENTTLPEIADYSIGHTMSFFQNPKLSGQRAKIAEKVLKRLVTD